MGINMALEEVDRELNIQKIIKIIWEYKIFIFCITFGFAVLSIIISLSISNTYTSKSLWAPTNPEDSLSSRLSQYTSLAGIAGVPIPGETATNSQEGIERIKSFDFFSNHFLPNVKLENIIAVKKWSAYDNKITYDKNLYDKESNTWVRKAKYPQTLIPSDQEVFLFL